MLTTEHLVRGTLRKVSQKDSFRKIQKCSKLSSCLAFIQKKEKILGHHAVSRAAFWVKLALTRKKQKQKRENLLIVMAL